MQIEKTKIPEVLIIQPKVFEDERGYFMESFHQKRFEEIAGPVEFVQDNESLSSYGVLRGLHFQKPPFTQGKLVRVIEGEVLDVAVDIREDSHSYGQYVSVLLSGTNYKQLWMPRGFAHGFVVLSETAKFAYKCDNYYAPAHDAGIMWNDPQIQIDWQIALEDIQLSEKDKKHPLFKEISGVKI